MDKYNLKTGDILLFDYNGNTGLWYYLSKMIKLFTYSSYTHVAMVLVNPTTINDKLTGCYIWHSSWTGIRDPQDNKIKLGVQITPFDDIYKEYLETNSNIYVRRINYKENPFTDSKINDIHSKVYCKLYDFIPKDWLEAIIHVDSEPKKTDRFWCSAFIGYIYSMCDIISSKIDWSILRPSDFSSSSQIPLNDEYILGIEEKIL